MFLFSLIYIQTHKIIKSLKPLYLKGLISIAKKLVINYFYSFIGFANLKLGFDLNNLFIISSAISFDISSGLL